MFIRRTQTRRTADGKPYFSHRLVHTERLGHTVRQRTLLNLGRHFDIAQADWPLLCTDRLVEQGRVGGDAERGGVAGDEEPAKRLLIHLGRLLEDGAGLRLQVHQPSRIVRARRPPPPPRTRHGHGPRASHGPRRGHPGSRHGQHMVPHAGERMLESPPHEGGSGPGDRVCQRVVLGDNGVREEDDEPIEGHRTYKLPSGGQRNLDTAAEFEKLAVVM